MVDAPRKWPAGGDRMAADVKARVGALEKAGAAMGVTTDVENERMLEKIEALMDKGEKRSSAEDRLLELMVKLVEDFEARQYTIEESSPAEVLAYLIEQRGIRQADLLPVLGCSKSFMSEMVSGRREISKVNAKKLAAFFHKPVDLFV